MKVLDSEVTTMQEEEKMTQEQNEAITVDSQDEAVQEEESNTDTPEIETFTQEQVNEFVRNRLDKYEKRLYKRYGVEDKNGLDDLVGKANSYSVMEEMFNNQAGELANLREQNAFLKNNINPEKYDDIRAYFKGKGLEFNEEALINELSTHNEWLVQKEEENKPKTTTITTLGADAQLSTPKPDEKSLARKVFGLNNLV